MMAALAIPLLAQMALPKALEVETVRWEVLDAAQGKVYVLEDSGSRLTEGGRLSAEPGGSGLSLTVDYRPGERATELRVRLADASGEDRGLVLRVGLVLAGAGEQWTWWQDLDYAMPLSGAPLSNTAGLRGLPGLPEFTGEVEQPQYGRYSVYPLGVLSRGEEWTALARRLGELLVARFTAVGGRQAVLSAEVDVALSEYTTPPRAAEFSLWFMKGEGAAGLRHGLARCYELWPEDWQVRVRQYGGWMPFSDLSKIANVDEFGFAYQEGAPNAAFDDVLGALSFVYFHCAGEFANVEGYERGTEPLPPYEDVVAAFNAVAESRTGIKGVWDMCGIRGPDERIAYRPESTYGDFFCQACVDPDLPYGRVMVEKLLERVQAKEFPEGIDGVYYDGIAAGLDYAPEHLRAANHLLLWDAERRKPLNYNLFSSAEWAQAIHETLAGSGKLTMLNDGSLSSFAYVIPYIDIPGGEMGINLRRAEARLIRAYTWRKPFCTLVKADFAQYESAHIETYMRRCVAYGILPGFFDISPSGAHPGSSYWVHPEWYDRDRPLFRRYMPLARELAAAGWSPVAGAGLGAAGEGAYAESFGPADGGLAYLTVSTDPGEQPEEERTVKATLGEGRAARDGLAVELLTGRIEPAGREVEMRLRGDDVAVWAIGEGAAQAAACLDRALDLLGARRRYVEACKSAGTTLTPWSPYGDGGGKIVSPGRESRHCLEASAAEAGRMAGASQTFVTQHREPQRLIISAWSKAENVTGEKDSGYALYVDCYYTDGTALYGQTVPFATGTHDWEYGERVLEPAKPVRNVNVYLLFRGNHTGRVWFDDVRVALADKPEENLVRRPGFEAAEGHPLTEGETAEAISKQLAGLEAALAAGPREVDFAAAFATLEGVEKAARQADWGPDSDRTVRDVEDLRWHVRLAQACLDGKPQAGQRASRITDHVALVVARRATGVTQYTARTGKVPPGTQLVVDSLYEGYSVAPLTDGKINPTGVHWTEVAWASEDGDMPHWVELRLPEGTTLKEVRVWWARDSGKLWPSRATVVQERRGEEWVTIEARDVSVDLDRGVTTLRFEPRRVERVRILQGARGGPLERPGIMWISEVEVE